MQVLPTAKKARRNPNGPPARGKARNDLRRSRCPASPLPPCPRDPLSWPKHRSEPTRDQWPCKMMCSQEGPSVPEATRIEKARRGECVGYRRIRTGGHTRLNGSKLCGSTACIPAESRIASWCEGDDIRLLGSLLQTPFPSRAGKPVFPETAF